MSAGLWRSSSRAAAPDTGVLAREGVGVLVVLVVVVMWVMMMVVIWVVVVMSGSNWAGVGFGLFEMMLVVVQLWVVVQQCHLYMTTTVRKEREPGVRIATLPLNNN